MTCSCHVCDVWKEFISGKLFGWRMYELITKELVDAIALHIGSLRSGNHRLNVLEVGAGNGRLSYFLSKALCAHGSGDVSLACTDLGSRGLDLECGTAFSVERLDCEGALAKYQPQVVLACWMELGQDWTEAFRACHSIQQYILIGEADSSVCGRPYETWGIPHPSGRSTKAAAAPYERQGFERIALKIKQIGKTDDPWCRASRSQTIVFNRK